MLNFGGRNVAAEVCDVLESKGYTCAYTLLNAANYGVPQTRERAFLVGLRRELEKKVDFPCPTHWINLPAGYQSTRAVALNLVADSDGLFVDPYFRVPTEAKESLEAAVTAEDALGDLPRIDARAELAAGRLTRGARRLSDALPCPAPQHMSAYGRMMRTWPGFTNGGELCDHVIRYLPRDYPLFARLDPGDQYPEARSKAIEMFDEALGKVVSDGKEIPPTSEAWHDLRSQIVPPYDDTKFPNKWRKMEADKPARTLMAHLGKDSYSHIHYDSAQARTISVREAARLQSFPDGFRFSGTMNPAFRQIGNAVPPLLALAIGSVLGAQLGIRETQLSPKVNCPD